MDDLFKFGLVANDGDCLRILELRFMWSAIDRQDGFSYLVLTPMSDADLEEMLRDRGSEFTAWLWDVMERANLLLAFIPVGLDNPYFEGRTSPIVDQLAHLSDLLTSGEMRVVHPLMMFADRLGHSRPCEKAKTTSWGLQQYRAGIGCLVGFTSATENGFDIMEPGPIYPELLRDWS